jgi:hypothetical protein
MQTQPTLNRRKLFIEWVLAHTIGMLGVTPTITAIIISIITWLVGFFFIVIRNPATLTGPLPLVANELFMTLKILIPVLSIVIPSILLGVFQWLVLRAQIVHSRKWILVSFIGLSIGLSISAYGGYSLAFNKNLPSINPEIISGGIGAIIGATLGIAQWLFLRKHVKYSGIWILGSLISCSIATNVAWGFPSSLGFVPGDDTGFPIIVGFILLVVRLMVIYSITSGIMLTWMLNHPIKELQSSVVQE